VGVVEVKVNRSIKAVRTRNVAERDQVFFGGLVRCERRQVDVGGGGGRGCGGVGLVCGGGWPMSARCWRRGRGGVWLGCGRAQQREARRWSGRCGPRRVVFGHVWCLFQCSSAPKGGRYEERQRGCKFANLVCLFVCMFVSMLVRPEGRTIQKLGREGR